MGEGDLGPGGAFFGGVAVERGSPSVCSRECDFVCLFWTVRTGILKNTYKYFEGAGRCLECVQILKVCANMLGVRTHILVGAICAGVLGVRAHMLNVRADMLNVRADILNVRADILGVQVSWGCVQMSCKCVHMF